MEIFISHSKTKENIVTQPPRYWHRIDTEDDTELWTRTRAAVFFWNYLFFAKKWPDLLVATEWRLDGWVLLFPEVQGNVEADKCFSEIIKSGHL